MYEKILVPLDGSKLARQVFPYVVELAKNFSSEAILVAVCDPEETEESKVCRLYLNNEAEKLKKLMRASAVHVKTAVLGGKPAEQILDYAEKNNIRVIIFSSHGRSGIKPWSVGSTVHEVLHKVGIPLIIVRAKEEDEPVKTGLFDTILIPLDGSKKAELVLPYVIELSKKVKFEVILTQVIEVGRHVHTIGGLEYVSFNDQDIDKEKSESRRYLKKIKSQFTGTKARVITEVRVGNSAEEIIKLTTEKDCSLIAMSSHGRSGIEAWVYGSVTRKILQTSFRSVMFVPSFTKR